MTSPERDFARFRQHADARALAAVFDALAPELLLIAAHVAVAGTEAEDLVQATFLDAIEKAERWDASRPLLPWLIGILVNHARLERRRRERALDADRLPKASEPSPLDAAAASEVAEHVSQALRKLPRHLRQALTLRLAHGLSPTEIAHALGCPVATVKTRLQRGTEWLRRVLPAGIAASVAGAVTPGRGLNAVRATVLASARTVVPVAAVGVAVGALAGGVLMQKMVFAGVAVLVAATLWFAVLRPEASAVVREGAGAATLAQAELPTAPLSTDTAPSRNASDRVEAAGATAAKGSAALEFVWEGDGAPAANLRVVVTWKYDARHPDGDHLLQARTDLEGRLLLRDLEPNAYSVGGYKFSRTIVVRAGEEMHERVVVDPAFRTDGTVVDGDGRGIAGASVLAQVFDFRDTLEPRLLAVTRADGRFRLATDQGGCVWAQKPGFAPSPYEQLLLPHMRLVLGSSESSVRGTVLTADGAPATAARITIVHTLPPDRSAAPLTLHSDSRGCFATDELRSGEHLLVAQMEGHAATPMPFTVTAGEGQDLTVHVARGGTLVGAVMTADAKPARADLCARPTWAREPATLNRGGPLAPLFQLCAVTAATDADGHYRLANVPVGPVILEVRPEHAVSRSLRLQVSEGELQQRDVVLAAGSSIRGRVVDAKGRPLANWDVHAFSSQSGVGTTPTRTDPLGAFTLHALSDAGYRVTAYPMDLGDLPWIAVDNVQPGEGELLLRATLTEADAGQFVVTALDEAGAATTIRGAYVSPGDTRGASCAVRRRADGRFQLGPLPPGSYSVRVSFADQTHLDLGTHELAPRAEVDLGTARQPPAGTMELRLLTPDGRRVAPLELMAVDAVGNGGELQLGDDGIFRSLPLPAGTYRVRVWGEDFARLVQPAVVVGDRATLTELTVTPATAVHFDLPRPAAANSPWVANVELELKDTAGKTTRGFVAVDTTGTFTWTRGLPPGGYTFEAKLSPGGEPVRGAFTVTDAREQHVEIKMPVPGR